MLKTTYRSFPKTIAISVLLLLTFVQTGFTQNITGPTPTGAYSTQTYEYASTFMLISPSWTITGGTLTTNGLYAGTTTYYATVQWGAAGSGTVTIKNGSTTLSTLNVTISTGSSSTGLSNENYVHTLTPRIATTDVTQLDDDDKLESVNYFDGLGRAMQSIGIRAGGNEEDILTHMEYDALGRQTKEYMPYAVTSNGGSYATLAGSATTAFYNTTKYENTTNPYSEKAFEASPLNRVTKQAAPGSDWAMGQGHEIELGYLTNASSEVRNYTVSLSFANNTYTPTLTGGTGYYAAGELYKSVTKDENHTGTTKNHTTEEFKDKLGRVILKRTYADVGSVSTAHDTYYVYDDHGNLSYVLPPKTEANTALPTAAKLDDLCYQYVYDHRNRLVEKKIPGKGWEYIVYNLLDQPVMTQDANQKAKSPDQWNFSKYDAFGRVAYTGFVNSNASRVAIQNSASNANYVQYETRRSEHTVVGTNIYYTDSAFPSVAVGSGLVEILTINYYDDYNWDTNQSYEASYAIDTPHTGLTISGNTISKTSGGNSWNAGFNTTATIDGDGYIQWTATQTDKLFMVGLSETSSAENDNYNTIDYAIYIGPSNNKRVYIYEEGVSQYQPSIYFEIGDVFRVERSGDQILYKINDIVVHTSITPSVGTLIGDSSFATIGAAIENVFIGYSALGQAFTSNVKGLATGSKVRVLGTANWTTSSTYYDDKARPIHTSSVNSFLDTEDAISTQFDFIGQALKTHSTHKLGANLPIVSNSKFSYDHAGRLLTQTQKVNLDNEELITKNNYDALGQLVQKQVGGNISTPTNYINMANVSASGNDITKTSGTNAWNVAGVATQETIPGDGYIGFKVTSVLESYMVGLSYTDSNVHYNTIDYAIYIVYGSTRRVFVYENGVNKGEKTKYVVGDEFSIERRGTTIHYLKNGEIFYTSLAPTTTAPMLGDVSIYHTGALIKDLLLVDLEKSLQDVNYTYNVRGWLKGINNTAGSNAAITLGSGDLFGFQINYNNPTDATKKLFNGNISQTLWNTTSVNPAPYNTVSNKYTYTYDALNRITSGSDSTGKYDLYGLTYDKNGNIKTLKRDGKTHATNNTFGLMDDLTYHYDKSGESNQLIKVIDASGTEGFKDSVATTNDYWHDVNGNMKQDNNKGIVGINYNHLNLPTLVIFSATKKIEYFYDATGVKLRKRVIDSGNPDVYTYYAGNYIYEDSTLKFFSHPEGYVEPDGSDFNYVYQYKDHLGNIRLSYSDNNDNGLVNSSEIIEENNYYPFGLRHKGYNNVINGTDHPYGFGGKEEQDELGLGWIDITARNYDPALGRWMNLDPLAEQMRRHSPYNYAFNNPIFFMDPDGMSPDWIRTVGDNGTITYEAEAGDSAWSLYTQHGEKDGFTAEQADEIVQDGHGPNRVVDGKEYSNISPEDTVAIHTDTGQESTEAEINTPEETSAEGLTTSTSTATELEIPNMGLFGDVTGANAEMERTVIDMNQSLDIYEAEGLMPYLYDQIGNAHSDIGINFGQRKTSNKSSSGSRGTTSAKATSSQTVTVSGQKKTIQTGSRGGKYYINKNGNKTYLNRDGTKRN